VKKRLDVQILLKRKKLSITLPDDFISHYLQFNGGIPEKSWWDGDEDFEPIEVAAFKPFIYNSQTNNDPGSLIDGAISAWWIEVIPKTCFLSQMIGEAISSAWI
jgi:hypothetical protein